MTLVELQSKRISDFSLQIHGVANVLAQYAAALQSVIFEFEIENYWMHKSTKYIFMARKFSSKTLMK